MHPIKELNRFALTSKLSALVLGIMVLAGPGGVLASDSPRVELAHGPVQGVMDAGVESFRGIRYAQPPVGARRWQPPVPVEPWSENYDASEFGAACPQPMETGFAPIEVRTDEDCLFLNIWTSSSGDRERPVMVWLHGGGHKFGAGSMDFYNGSELAGRDAVVVTVNYRLGMLGYFAHPEINDGSTGNFGLLDQIAALEWVRDNIAAFGGNPDNVTVFGESAGAVDIQHLMTIDRSRDLFDKAIIQSGGGWANTKSRGAQRDLVDDVIEHLDLESATGESLREVSPGHLVEALSATSGGLGFGPFIDGNLITRSPKEAFAAGETAPVPMIVGSNDWEGSLLEFIDLGPKQEAVIHLPGVRSLYEGQYESDEELKSLLFGDIGFVAPARWLARQHASRAPAFLYHFTYVPHDRRDTVPGVAHAAEIPFVFGTLDARQRQVGEVNQADTDVAHAVMDCWASFARRGRPECDLGKWARYEPERDNTFLIGDDSGEVNGFRSRTLDMLTQFFGPKARVD